MLNVLDYADLLGWSDVDVIENIETQVLPTDSRLYSCRNSLDWSDSTLSQPLVSEKAAQAFLFSRLAEFGQHASWRQLLASLFDNGVYAWQLRRYVLNPDLLTYDEACRVLERHFESFVASCEDEDPWDEDSWDVDSIPKYCDEYVILDLYRGTAGSGLERFEVAASVTNLPESVPAFPASPLDIILTPKPALQIDCRALLQKMHIALIRDFTLSQPPEIISAHDSTGIPYRRAWMMKRQGKLKVANLLQEFQIRLTLLAAKHSSL